MTSLRVLFVMFFLPSFYCLGHSGKEVDFHDPLIIDACTVNLWTENTFHIPAPGPLPLNAPKKLSIAMFSFKMFHCQPFSIDDFERFVKEDKQLPITFFKINPETMGIDANSDYNYVRRGEIIKLLLEYLKPLEEKADAEREEREAQMKEIRRLKKLSAIDN